MRQPVASSTPQVLEALGPEGTFINVARGSVHDEDALIDALEAASWAMRVSMCLQQSQKFPKACATRQCHLQPHQGSATLETRTRHGGPCGQQPAEFASTAKARSRPWPSAHEPVNSAQIRMIFWLNSTKNHKPDRFQKLL